mmetsp:Transcript_53054/g.116108  ORF Transcript_53054/g.116108 Transcript_53054/m.116108 type:complete len:201 (-) Transcript_53054:777-1379(-)
MSSGNTACLSCRRCSRIRAMDRRHSRSHLEAFPKSCNTWRRTGSCMKGSSGICSWRGISGSRSSRRGGQSSKSSGQSSSNGSTGSKSHRRGPHGRTGMGSRSGARKSGGGAERRKSSGKRTGNGPSVGRNRGSRSRSRRRSIKSGRRSGSAAAEEAFGGRKRKRRWGSEVPDRQSLARWCRHPRSGACPSRPRQCRHSAW